VDRKARGEELTQRVEAAFFDLEAQLAEGHTRDYLQLLEFYARFRSHSPGNTALIRMQMPEASR